MKILVLDGNENQAVAAVRSLGRAGHEVNVGSDVSWSKAGWSRFAHRSFTYPSPRREPDAFVAALVREAARIPGTFVLPMTESATLPISERRALLEEAGARLVLPAHASVLRAFDKEETGRIAAEAGVATPRTRVVETEAEAIEAARDIGYPVVLKARSSENAGAAGAGRAAGVPRYARSPEALARVFEAMHRDASSLLVQEFIAGGGGGYFALLRRGELRAEFAHRRIRDVRPTGSGSAVRESIPVNPAVRDASLAILRALDWHGVAMVEFKMRPDGTPVFLEVNGRFWNSLALPIHAGVDFPRLVAGIAETGDCATVTSYRSGVRCRWFLGDVRHLVSVMAGPPAEFPGVFPRRLPTLLAFLRPVPGMRHDNLTLTDPLPGLGDWVHFFARRIPGALQRRSGS